MQVRSTHATLTALETPCLALGLFDDPEKIPNAITGATRDLIRTLLESKELSGAVGEVVGLHGFPFEGAAGTLWLFGMGKADAFGPGEAYSAAYAIVKRLSTQARAQVSLAMPPAAPERASNCWDAFVAGAIVATEGPGLHKDDPKRSSPEVLEFVFDRGLDGGEAWSTGRFETTRAVAEAVNHARHLINTPSAEKPPMRVAEIATETGRTAGFEVEVWDRERLVAERFGGLLGVSAGSDQPPAFVILRYRGGSGDQPTHALVGKGITFDSGGLSLKPSNSMQDMKADMSGAAVVLASVEAIARCKLPINVDGYLALAENMTGGSAMKLGDVLTMRNGKTVEVMNTDAEGRLVLADTLSYAAEQKPQQIVDLATLTGACLVALGQKVAGLMSNDESTAEALAQAAESVGERLWQLPMDADYFEQMKSQVADFKNVGTRYGGAITAAKFLEQFVDETPWAHIDIAGPSFVENDSGTLDHGGTGCFVRTLVALAESWS